MMFITYCMCVCACVQGCLPVGKHILKQIAAYFIVVGFVFAAFVVRYHWYCDYLFCVTCLRVSIYAKIVNTTAN